MIVSPLFHAPPMIETEASQISCGGPPEMPIFFSLWLVNCYFAYDSSGFQLYVTMLHRVENCWMEFLRTTGGKLQVTLFQLV